MVSIFFSAQWLFFQRVSWIENLDFSTSWKIYHLLTLTTFEFVFSHFFTTPMSKFRYISDVGHELVKSKEIRRFPLFSPWSNSFSSSMQKGILTCIGLDPRIFMPGSSYHNTWKSFNRYSMQPRSKPFWQVDKRKMCWLLKYVNTIQITLCKPNYKKQVKINKICLKIYDIFLLKRYT